MGISYLISVKQTSLDLQNGFVCTVCTISTVCKTGKLLKNGNWANITVATYCRAKEGTLSVGITES
jgi:hypothetical protein